MKILFILKRNETYGFCVDPAQKMVRRSAGLYNSTSFIVKSLRSRGIHAEIIEVQDNNDIDREVTKYKPDAVVIEALWVVPEKFPILKRLHPKVEWFVHLHSHMPFLAIEGIAMDWIIRYAEMGIGLIANSVDSYKALRAILDQYQIIYLPNVYLPQYRKHCLAKRPPKFQTLDVGCFGAIRSLKNQLLQSLAAIRYAEEIGYSLRFHVNSSRTETGGDPVLKNLRQLFDHQADATLVEHGWHEPQGFLDVLQNGIDIGMQVSLTETFNVVSADYVTAGIPMVVSSEVSWASRFCKASMSDIDSIVDRMAFVDGNRALVWWNRHLLTNHSENAQMRWADFCRDLVS